MPSPFTYARDEDEHSHQVALFMWVACATYNGWDAANTETSYAAPGWAGEKEPIPELKWLYAVPNGGQRDARVAAGLKAEGVKAGVHDLMLPVPRHGFHGLYIEMKKPGGRASLEQKDFGKFVDGQGYLAVLCDHWTKAAEVLFKYLDGASYEDFLALLTYLEEQSCRFRQD